MELTNKESAHILIADDEDTFLLSTTELLRKEGYQCDCVSDADSAINMLDNNEYDLLISDIRMPGNADLMLVKDSITKFENLSVILITGYPSVDTAVQAIQLPVFAYLVKPIDFPELLKEVKKAVNKSLVLHTMSNAANRLQNLQTEIENIKTLNIQHSHSANSFTTKSFMDFSLKNIYGSLTDLEYLLKSQCSKNMIRETCHLFNCPQNKLFNKTVSDTITALEKTKSSFKSKDLGVLRNKLESLIQGKMEEI